MWKENEIFGDVMNQLQQEELFVRNPDIVDSERIKIQQLVGKDEKLRKIVWEFQQLYGRKHYLLRGCWWTAPVNRETPQRLRTTAPNWPDWP